MFLWFISEILSNFCVVVPLEGPFMQDFEGICQQKLSTCYIIYI